MKKAKIRVKLIQGRSAEREFIDYNCIQYIRVSYSDLVIALGRPSYAPHYTWNIRLNGQHVYIMATDIDRNYFNLKKNQVFDPAKFSTDRFRWRVVTYKQLLEEDVLIALQNFIFARVNQVYRKQGKFSVNYYTLLTKDVDAFIQRHGLVNARIETHREDSSLSTIEIASHHKLHSLNNSFQNLTL